MLDSSEALDTFAEISTFITSLETGDVAGLSAALSTSVSNDAVHAAGISANSSAIANLDLDFTGDFDALGSAAAAQSTAISTAVSADAVVLSSAKSYADVAEADALSAANTEAGRLDAIVLSSAKSYTDGREVIIKAYADTAEADAIASAKTYTDTEIATLDSRIDGLEGASFEEVVANFVDATSFSSGVQFDLGNVKVFVNGLQIHEAGEGIDGWNSADGSNFTVAGLGYNLEADDHIIISGRLA